MISALDINCFAGVHRRVALREGSRQQDWDENPPLGGRREDCVCENSRDVRRHGRARSGGCADFLSRHGRSPDGRPNFPTHPPRGG